MSDPKELTEALVEFCAEQQKKKAKVSLGRSVPWLFKCFTERPRIIEEARLVALFIMLPENALWGALPPDLAWAEGTRPEGWGEKPPLYGMSSWEFGPEHFLGQLNSLIHSDILDDGDPVVGWYQNVRGIFVKCGKDGRKAMPYFNPHRDESIPWEQREQMLGLEQAVEIIQFHYKRHVERMILHCGPVGKGDGEWGGDVYTWKLGVTQRGCIQAIKELDFETYQWVLSQMWEPERDTISKTGPVLDYYQMKGKES